MGVYVTADGEEIDNSYDTLATLQENNINDQAGGIGITYDPYAPSEGTGLNINLPDVNDYDFGNDPGAFDRYLKDLEDAYNTGDGQPLSTSSSGGLGSLLKNFLGTQTSGGSTIGSGVSGLASLAASLAPLLQKNYSGAIDANGNAIQKTDISKFMPSGTYAPTSLGYGQNYGKIDPLAFNPTEMATGSVFWNQPRSADERYDALRQNGLSAEQSAHLWANATGGDKQTGLGIIQEYLLATGKELPGGYIPKNNTEQNLASKPQIRTKYAKGGGIPAACSMPGGLVPISARMVELLSGAHGGQDDVVDIKAAPGEYVMDADVVAALGDGNSEAGARKLDEMRMRIREHKRGGSVKQIPPKAKAITEYLKGK